jgi:hypothetical protein
MANGARVMVPSTFLGMSEIEGSNHGVVLVAFTRELKHAVFSDGK